MAERRPIGAHERAVRKDVRALADRTGIEAYTAVALELAKRLDAGNLEPGEQARLAAELRRTLVELGRVGTKKPVADNLDELRQRRQQRKRRQEQQEQQA
ncbi:hypothetical protein GCM10023259_080260 [Thermocatellispora tengchongensis]